MLSWALMRQGRAYPKTAQRWRKSAPPDSKNCAALQRPRDVTRGNQCQRNLNAGKVRSFAGCGLDELPPRRFKPHDALSRKESREGELERWLRGRLAAHKRMEAVDLHGCVPPIMLDAVHADLHGTPITRYGHLLGKAEGFLLTRERREGLQFVDVLANHRGHALGKISNDPG